MEQPITTLQTLICDWFWFLKKYFEKSQTDYWRAKELSNNFLLECSIQ